MNTQTNAVSESHAGSQEISSSARAAIRPLYWSIRRELWDFRSIYLAPLFVATVFLAIFALDTVRGAHATRAALALDPMQGHKALAASYDAAAALIMGAAFLVGLFYCLEALHSERRDRSILFWKSLPVSDRTTVLAKASIPMVVLQLLTIAITIATQWIMLLLSCTALLARGQSVATLWRDLSLPQLSLMIAYHLVTMHALWYAPIYAWLLLISAWARRAAFLWAVLPPLVIGMAELSVSHTNHFFNWLKYRVSGPEAFAFPGSVAMMDPMMTLAPGKFFSTPGLWTGLVAAALFLAAAARIRRYRGPI
jgi:ABC-2 type transport system permease protein